MLSDKLYRRNKNGRYEYVGCNEVSMPPGIHMIYVHHSPGCKSTLSCYDIGLDEVWKKAAVLMTARELTDLVYEATSLYPAEKLTEEERLEWEEFKKTKAGKKLCKGMYRKSAADIARWILDQAIVG